MSEKKQSTEGSPMFIESLMTREEWNQRMRDYPNTSRFSLDDVNRYKSNDFKWRYSMGKSLSQEEIDNINYNLDFLMEKMNVKPNL